MRGWKKCASVMLVFSGSALAQAPCPADLAESVRIGAQRFTVEVAATPATRARGLSGHSPLARRAGMWFVLPEVGLPGFWMRGMSFPIDLVWISPEQSVIGVATLPVCRNDPCPIAYPPAPVAYVLETGAGRFAGKIDDRVTWTCPDRAEPPTL